MSHYYFAVSCISSFGYPVIHLLLWMSHVGNHDGWYCCLAARKPSWGLYVSALVSLGALTPSQSKNIHGISLIALNSLQM